MTAMAMSPALIEWAGRVGYSFKPPSGTDPAEFWTDPGGELRMFVRETDRSWWTLHSSERFSDEQFELATASLDGLQKYLFAVFGSDIRLRHGAPRLRTPRKSDEVAPGFSLGDLDAQGRRVLFREQRAVALARGRVGSVGVLVELSHLLAASVAEIVRSYERADGRPLFTIK